MRLISIILLTYLFSSGYSQSNIHDDHGHTHEAFYDLSWQKDAILTGGVAIGWLASRSIVTTLDPAPTATVLALDRDDVWFLDRGATNNVSPSAESISDIFLFGSLALPITCYISHGVSREGVAMGVMLVESALLTDALTNFIKASVKRFRPNSYNPEVEFEVRSNRQARLSFLSGHTSMTAAMSFMSARVLTDLHPGSKWNKVIWGTAIVLPAFNGYLRTRAGRHFPTDVMAGYALGAGVGLLIPAIHKSEHVDFGPTQSGQFGLTWTF